MLKRKTEKPFLCSKNSIIIKVNNEFIDLTGYSRNELIGKSLVEISNMLRIDSQVCLENIENEHSCYVFTKDYEARNVSIGCKIAGAGNEKICFFKEKANSRIEDKFQVTNRVLLDNQIGIGIFSLPDLTLLKGNQYYLDLLGDPYNKKEATIGKKVNDFIHLWESSKCKEIWMNVINTGESFCGKEIKGLTQNWEDFYLDNHIVPVIENGKVKYIVSIVENVTEKVLLRKKSEEQAEIIKHQKERLEVIIESMHDGLVIVDKNYNQTLLNSSAKELLYNSDSVKNVNDALGYTKYYDSYGNLLQLEDMPVSRILKGEKIKECRLTCSRPDGIYHFNVSGSPVYDKNGNIEEAVNYIQDVTDKVKYQESLLLKTQLDLFKNIIENLDIGFTRYSYPEFKIIDINNKAYRDLKQINPKVGPLSALKGSNYFDAFLVDEKVRSADIVENLIKGRKGSYFSYRTIIADGEERFLKFVHQPLFGLNNSIVEIINIAVDITDEVKAKNKLKETLKMQEKVFANVSHELKTPLNVIYSTSQLMDFYLKHNELEVTKKKLFNNINIIKQNCYRFTKLINNIVDLSKIESGFLKLNLSNENIVKITEDIVQSISGYVKSKGLSIVFDTNIEEKIIACDPEKIERIVLNLISNAIKFTNPGGEILVSVLDKGDNVEIAVKDTGIGIDEKYLHNIFGRFYQIDKSLSRNAEGSGIGLSLVKSIVELHGGKISVESKVGEGSVFKIELPARIIENLKVIEETNLMNNKIEMINIEFSDIYSIIS